MNENSEKIFEEIMEKIYKCYCDESSEDSEEEVFVEFSFERGCEIVCDCLQCNLIGPGKCEKAAESGTRERLRKKLEMKKQYTEEVKAKPVEIKKPAEVKKVKKDDVKAKNTQITLKNSLVKDKKPEINAKEMKKLPSKPVPDLAEKPETKKKVEKQKLSPKGKQLKLLEVINEDLLEVSTKIKQTQNQLSQLSSSKGRNKKEKIGAADTKLKTLKMHRMKLEEEAKTIFGVIKDLSKDVDLLKECEEMKRIAELLVVKEEKKIENLVAPKIEKEEISGEQKVAKKVDESKEDFKDKITEIGVAQPNQLYKMVDGKFVPVPTPENPAGIFKSSQVENKSSPVTNQILTQPNLFPESKFPGYHPQVYQPSVYPANSSQQMPSYPPNNFVPGLPQSYYKVHNQSMFHQTPPASSMMYQKPTFSLESIPTVSKLVKNKGIYTLRDALPISVPVAPEATKIVSPKSFFADLLNKD